MTCCGGGAGAGGSRDAWGQCVPGGGDEFCLLLRAAPGQMPDLDAVLAGEGLGPVGASAGWASAPQDRQHPEVLWQLADERMCLKNARRRPGR